MPCNCDGWKDGWKQMEAQAIFCQFQSAGPRYNGPLFSFCPWCGASLDSSPEPDDAPELAELYRQLEAERAKVAELVAAANWLWGFWDGNTIRAIPGMQEDAQAAFEQLMAAAVTTDDKVAELRERLANCGRSSLITQDHNSQLRSEVLDLKRRTVELMEQTRAEGYEQGRCEVVSEQLIVAAKKALEEEHDCPITFIESGALEMIKADARAEGYAAGVAAERERRWHTDEIAWIQKAVNPTLRAEGGQHNSVSISQIRHILKVAAAIRAAEERDK